MERHRQASRRAQLAAPMAEPCRGSTPTRVAMRCATIAFQLRWSGLLAILRAFSRRAGDMMLVFSAVRGILTATASGRENGVSVSADCRHLLYACGGRLTMSVIYRVGADDGSSPMIADSIGERSLIGWKTRLHSRSDAVGWAACRETDRDHSLPMTTSRPSISCRRKSVDREHVTASATGDRL